MSWKKILQIIKRYKKFLISTHVNPDADALASQLSVALYLKSLGKKVSVINTEDVSQRFNFIPGINLIQRFQEDKKSDFDVAIIVDCGDLERIDKVKNLFKKDTIVINIDHHLTNDFFGTVNFVNPSASSTAEVLFDFFKKAQFPLTKDIAILLYLGIMTDTGSFRYDSTTAHTHAIVSELMQFKFSVNDFYRKLYEQIHWGDLKLFLKVINRFEKLYDGKVICVEMRKKMINQFSTEFDIRDKIFTFLRGLRGIEVIVILSEHGPQMTRVNFRAQGDKVNVAELASIFKGGGHRKASGCMIHENLNRAKEKLLPHLEKRLC